MRDPNETPELTEVIEELIEDRLMELNTQFPATVKAVNKAQGLIDVMPDFKRRYADQEKPVDPPTIRGVPWWSMRIGTLRTNFPVKVGDRVWCMCSQRALQKWKDTGALDTPGSSRIHSISDAVAIPGFYPIPESKPIGDNYVMEYGDASIEMIEGEEVAIKVVKALMRLTKDGKISLTEGTVELIDMCIQALEAQNATIDLMLAMTFPTSLGPTGTMINAADFNQQKQKNQQLIDKLSKLKR